MTRKYTLVIEGDSDGYSAYVPELPTILVTGMNSEEITARATEAISLYLANVPPTQSPTATLREIEVDLPAQLRGLDYCWARKLFQPQSDFLMA